MFVMYVTYFVQLRIVQDPVRPEPDLRRRQAQVGGGCRREPAFFSRQQDGDGLDVG